MSKKGTKANKFSHFNCDACRYFLTERLQTEKHSCSKLGMLEVSHACPKFKPNVRSLDQLIKEQGDTLQVLADLVKQIPASKLHVLSALLYLEKITRKYGYRFMQRVYVRHMGTTSDNYLNNFLPAYVLEANKKEIRFLSRDGQTYYVKTGFTPGELSGPDIFSVKNFKVLKAEMVAKGRLEDPRRKRSKPNSELYVESLNLALEKVDTKEKKRIRDLVSLVEDIESGFIARKSSSYRIKRAESKAKAKADAASKAAANLKKSKDKGSVTVKIG
jgi:hypothetical protein